MSPANNISKTCKYKKYFLFTIFNFTYCEKCGINEISLDEVLNREMAEEILTTSQVLLFYIFTVVGLCCI